jgi:hypothetical protein
MANDNDEVIQLYKDPMKAFAHVFLLSTNRQVEEIGRKLGRQQQRQRKKLPSLSDTLKFTLEGLIEFLYSERFEEYAEMFDQDPARMRSRFFTKLAGEEKVCPKCKKTGRVFYEFGYRKIGDKLFVQSWCQECRNKR